MVVANINRKKKIKSQCIHLGLWDLMNHTPLALAEPGHLHRAHVGPGQALPVPAPGEDLDTLAGVWAEALVDVEVRRSLETHSIAPSHHQAGAGVTHPLLV